MLVRGNLKLGPLVHHFSTTASVTCPGETPECAEHCYAMKHFFLMPSVQEHLALNHQLTLTSDFVEQIVNELKRKHVRLLRIHSSGDFYDAGYIRKWVQIIRRCSSTQFFAYTRSWRKQNLLSALGDLHKLKNMQLWWSADKDTHLFNGRPPRWRGTRVAFMASDYDQWIPPYADLVFRTKRATVQKYMQGRLVCPAENGVQTKNKMTCSDCGLCYGNRKIPRQHHEPQLVQLELV